MCTIDDYNMEAMTNQSMREDPLHFKISNAPKYPFVNQSFDLHISLVDDTGRVKSGKEVPMAIKVLFEDMEECPRQVFEIDRLTPCKVHSNGKAIVRITLITSTATFGDRRFVVVASPLLDTDSFISHAVTTPMTCVKYKLELENVDDIPALWYKDQGGKLKSIDLHVMLMGPRGTPVTGKMVPLRLELRYDNGEVVPTQEILETTRDTRLMVDSKGAACVRVRINEVSMRHQGKLFCIYVHPDTRRDPLSCDISPASTPGIEIRSKIVSHKNKRTLEEASGTGSSMSTSSPPDPFVQGQTHMTPGIQHMPALSMPPRVTGRASTASYEGEGGMGGRSTVCDLLTRGQHHPHSAPHALTHPNAFSFEASQAAPVTASAATADSLLPHTHRTVPVCDPTADPPDIYAWAEMVTQHLDSLRWRQIGYERMMGEGGEGTTRPLYDMSNPNDFIDDIIHKYTKVVSHWGKRAEVGGAAEEGDYCHDTYRWRAGGIHNACADAGGEAGGDGMVGDRQLRGRTGGDSKRDVHHGVDEGGVDEEGEEHDVDILPEGLKLGTGLSRDNSLYLPADEIWK